MIQFSPYAPDLGPYSGTSTDVVKNIMWTSNGVIPIPGPVAVSDSLGSDVYGAWIFRNTVGNYTLIAATKTNLWQLETDRSWTDISKVGGYVGPDEGDLWQADQFGTMVIFVNINDPPQKLDIDAMGLCADLGGSPPKAKFIETVGDFVFLSYLRIGADTFPRKAQHSRLNDAEDWLIDGLEGSSDMIECPDGNEIMGIFSRTGGAMLVQRNYKRLLTFSPGTPTAFTMTDIDPVHGAIAPNAIVPISGGNYIYLAETGFYMGDNHTPIGAEKVDRTFMKDVNIDRLGSVQGYFAPQEKNVWWRYQDGSDNYKVIGYNWALDQWTFSDIPAKLIVRTAVPATEMDDLTGLMDLLSVDGGYGDIPMDSLSFKGGHVTPGCFKEVDGVTGDVLHQFTGLPLQATIEFPTTQLTQGRGSFVRTTQLLGDAKQYSINVGRTTLPEGDEGKPLINWTTESIRSARTGKCPHRVDGKYHRFRVTIPAGTSWSICHGLEPTFDPSGEA